MRAHHLLVVGTALCAFAHPTRTESDGTVPYRIVIASPLKSAFAIRPV